MHCSYSNWFAKTQRSHHLFFFTNKWFKNRYQKESKRISIPKKNYYWSMIWLSKVRFLAILCLFFNNMPWYSFQNEPCNFHVVNNVHLDDCGVFYLVRLSSQNFDCNNKIHIIHVEIVNRWLLTIFKMVWKRKSLLSFFRLSTIKFSKLLLFAVYSEKKWIDTKAGVKEI